MSSGRVRSWMQRDSDTFRAESREVGWGAWFFAVGVLWVLGLAVMAVLAAIGRPMWSFVSVVLISVTGGLGLARAQHRHMGRRSEEP